MVASGVCAFTCMCFFRNEVWVAAWVDVIGRGLSCSGGSSLDCGAVVCYCVGTLPGSRSVHQFGFRLCLSVWLSVVRPCRTICPSPRCCRCPRMHHLATCLPTQVNRRHHVCLKCRICIRALSKAIATLSHALASSPEHRP